MEYRDYELAQSGNSNLKAKDELYSVEEIIGSNRRDEFKGSKFGDIFHGAEGDDLLQGNDGDDKLIGGNGNNYLSGGDGNDELQVFGNGSNVLRGGKGDDKLYGGSGSDLLEGGKVMIIWKGEKAVTSMPIELLQETILFMVKVNPVIPINFICQIFLSIIC
ncbi:RTX-III toxin determinant A from serotype 8 [Actinobacillus seminis]|uniref:RTX-III toxin determinant A from serotype 8 n=1 Tax=Actinobacillus seminis TaxID=722 RepID=A0A380VHH4_9PAST|nr:calcium-binding protein [Actinobacillus seminis]SUU38485.1 RTX-III toxin determinant A from serotype 8 [Actinobacillus seminis]